MQKQQQRSYLRRNAHHSRLRKKHKSTASSADHESSKSVGERHFQALAKAASTFTGGDETERHGSKGGEREREIEKAWKMMIAEE